MWRKKSSYDDSYLFPMSKKERLQGLQRKAYYDVIHAFAAESFELSDTRVMIITNLLKEWDISRETYYTVQNRLEHEPLIQHLRNKKDNTTLAKSISENPESLVGQWIQIRLPDEDQFTAFHVKDYNKGEGTHYLVSAHSITKYEDPCDWIDIKLFVPGEDIEWAEEPPQSLEQPGRLVQSLFRTQKPGRNLYEETLLRAASIAEEEKLLKELRTKFHATPTVSGSLWVSGSGESLIGKQLRLLLTDEVERILVVKAYDTKHKKHLVQNIDPDARETEPYLIDLRDPPEDLFWDADHEPNQSTAPEYDAYKRVHLLQKIDPDAPETEEFWINLRNPPKDNPKVADLPNQSTAQG